MPNVMVALPNIGGALCSMLQSLADATVIINFIQRKVEKEKYKYVQHTQMQQATPWKKRKTT